MHFLSAEATDVVESDGGHGQAEALLLSLAMRDHKSCFSIITHPSTKHMEKVNTAENQTTHGEH